MSADAAGPDGSALSEGLGPAAWAVVAFGRVQKLVVRADVADELACKWRESDPEATAVPLYTWAAVEAEREGLPQGHGRLRRRYPRPEGFSVNYTPEEVAKMLANRPNQPHYIAALIAECVAAARADERERCARVAVDVADAAVKKHAAMAEHAVKQPYANNRLMHVGWDAAAAIRALPPSL